MAARAVGARPAAWSGALWALAVWLTVLPAATGAQPTPATTAGPTAAPTATAAPVPLPEIATRSDDLGVYLKQLEERLAPTEETQTIEAQLPALDDRIRGLRAHTASAISSSPSLHEVDELLDQWRSLQDGLSDWGTTLTARATLLGQELQGLDELRSMWLATRESAKAAGAPAELAGSARPAGPHRPRGGELP